MATVTLITGDINEGKTSLLIRMAETLEKGTYDGFACVKHFNENQSWKGYDLLRLSDQSCITALILKEFYKDEFIDFFVHGPFMFSLEAFYNAEQILRSLLQDPAIKTILIDEVGLVEVKGLGYAHFLIEALQSNKHLILVINARHVQSVLKHFKIADSSILKIIQAKPSSS